MVTPGTVTPGTVTPGTVTPGTGTLGAGTPGTVTPGIAMPVTIRLAFSTPKNSLFISSTENPNLPLMNGEKAKHIALCAE